MRLYIIRHADPDYPNNTITTAGHLEAAALARRMAAERLTHLYASTLPRAYITAQYTADLVKLPVERFEWLVEPDWFHYEDENTGKEMPAWDIPGETLRGDSAYHSWETWNTAPLLAQHNYHADFERFGAGADALLAKHGYQREGTLYRIERQNTESIAIYCHNGAALLWLSHLLHIPPPLVWMSFWHAPSSVTTVLFEERGAHLATPRCLSVGDVSHLYEARLPVQPRGIRGNYR